MQNLLSSEKRTLDHWVLFLHSPGKTLLTLSLVQKWLGSPFPEDVWAWWLLMHWLQLQSTPCEALTSVWISFAWLYSQACSHPCCLCTFSYPNSSFQSTLICFDTALCKQPHLSVMTLFDLPSLWRVSMSVFWTIANSAVFSIIVVFLRCTCVSQIFFEMHSYIYVYKKRSDKWPNVFSKWKNKSRCSEMNSAGWTMITLWMKKLDKSDIYSKHTHVNYLPFRTGCASVERMICRR